MRKACPLEVISTPEHQARKSPPPFC
jgi:hypothetical protein